MWKKVLLSGVMATMMMGATAMAAATPLVIGGSSSVFPLAEKLATGYSANHSDIDFGTKGSTVAKTSTLFSNISYSDSGTGIKQVAGTVLPALDIANASRDLTSSDPTGLVSTTIAKDAVVMIINPKNPLGVTNFTFAQIKGIYSGAITNWMDTKLGGDGTNLAINNIVVENREATSGTFDCFTKVFMAATPASPAYPAVAKTATTPAIPAIPAILASSAATALTSTTANTAISSQDMIAKVVANANAIGYVSMGYVTSTSGVTACQLEGMKAIVASCYPVTETNGTTVTPYKAVRNFNLITKGAPSATAQNFINYILSTSGQSIVSADGEVPIVQGTYASAKKLSTTKH
jgi:phosphate transport system substrate-binding protein